MKSPQEREQQNALNHIVKVLKSAETQFGSKTTKWAVNKYLNTKREKEVAIRKKAELERELAELEKIL